MLGNSKKQAVGIAVAAMSLAAFAQGGVAQAAQCSASAVKVDGKSLLSSLALNPFQVGVNRNCSDQRAQAANIVNQGASIQAATEETSNLGGAHSQVAHAYLNVNISGASLLTVDAYALETSAAALCFDGPSGFATASQVAQVVVNGHPITIPRHDAPMTIWLPLGVTVYLNRVQSTRNAVTVDAVSVTTGLLDVNLAESRLSGSPCSFGPILD